MPFQGALSMQVKGSGSEECCWRASMIHQRKILILTSKTGGGHMSLAEALRDRLQQEFTISMEDLLPGLFPRHYQFVAQIEELNRSQHWDLDPNRLTFFASSGAEGATDVEQAAQFVLAMNQDVQVILATGTNWVLYRRCQGVKSLYAFPFTSGVAKFMAVAQTTIGRCSPNILFESLALGKPVPHLRQVVQESRQRH